MMTLRVACVVALLSSLFAAGEAGAQASIRDGALRDWMALKDTMMKMSAAIPEDKFHVAEANVNQIGRLGPKAMAPGRNLFSAFVQSSSAACSVGATAAADKQRRPSDDTTASAPSGVPFRIVASRMEGVGFSKEQSRYPSRRIAPMRAHCAQIVG